MTIIDMHVHLKFRSKCSNLPAEDIFKNLSPCIDAICVTDHWLLKPKINSPFPENRVFYGVELDCIAGDVLAYGIRSLPLRKRNMKAERIINYIHLQGGIAVCAHPYSNRHTGFGDKVFKYDFDAIEINGTLSHEFHEMAEEAAFKMDVPTIGGSDAHNLTHLNTVGTKFEGSIRTIKDIVKAVRDKRCKAIIFE